MEVTWEVDGTDLHVGVSGKITTLGAMDLEEKLAGMPEGITSIIFDFAGLKYIASSGLRVLYWAYEYTNEKGGRTVVKNVEGVVMKLLQITGFTDFLVFE